MPPELAGGSLSYWTTNEVPSVIFAGRLLLLLSDFIVSDSMRPHRWQPTRLPRPWDSLGKNIGVGCHFLLQCMKVKVKVKSLSHVRLLTTPWTVAHQAPPSMGFSMQEYWSGVLLPPPLMWQARPVLSITTQYERLETLQWICREVKTKS